MRRALIISLLAIICAAGGLVARSEGWLAGPLAALRRALQPAAAKVDATVDPEARELAARLAAENAVLRDRLAQWSEIPGEGLAVPDRLVAARGRIIGRSDRAGRRYLELDVGRIDGAAKGMPACIGWSLVGEVATADDGRSLVQEVGDSRFRCAAVVMEPGQMSGSAGADDATRSPAPAGSLTRGRLAEGVVAGDGRAGVLVLEIIGAGPDLALREGQAVTTAGADGRFPPGLALGRTARFRREAGDRWLVEVIPFRSPLSAESLLLIKP